jgi:MbtH protein
MFDDETREFVAIKNAEEQYSLWPADQAPPQGWDIAGGRGDKGACLAFIESNWTDMRPLSLRRQMTDITG